MNAKTIIAAAVFALSGSAAFAGEITIDTTPFVAQKTRAEVIAEVRQGLAAGESYIAGEGDRAAAKEQGVPRTRAEVRAELAQARASGELATLQGEGGIGNAAFAAGPGLKVGKHAVASASAQGY